MKMKLMPALAASGALLSASAYAESVEDMCLRVSEEWGTQGDVVAQCSCLAAKAADDAPLEAELKSLGEKYSSDQEAYDASSDETKAAFDACSVNS